MNKMISSIQHEATNDLNLINESSMRLRTLLNESNTVMQDYQNATERLRNMITQVNLDAVKKSESLSPLKNVVYEHKKLDGVVQKNNKEKKGASIDPDSSFLVKNIQQSLFDEDLNTPVIKDETTITPEGAAYKQVPLFITEVYDDTTTQENQNTPKYDGPTIIENIQTEKTKKKLSEKIKYLYAQGVKEEDIANQLSCSITEVQLVIGLI